jgi:hypothetical protein
MLEHFAIGLMETVAGARQIFFGSFLVGIIAMAKRHKVRLIHI